MLSFLLRPYPISKSRASGREKEDANNNKDNNSGGGGITAEKTQLETMPCESLIVPPSLNSITPEDKELMAAIAHVQSTIAPLETFEDQIRELAV